MIIKDRDDCVQSVVTSGNLLICTASHNNNNIEVILIRVTGI